jgi:hypothetical protein
MRRTTVEVAGGMPRSDTVNVRKNTVSTGAFAVSMPQPDRPLRNDSWPGQLTGMQEMGGQERMCLETSPSCSSHAVAPADTKHCHRFAKAYDGTLTFNLKDF